MKVALAALSARGAMGQYLGSLVPALSELVELHLFVPEHYTEPSGKARTHRFPLGRTRGEALRRLLGPLSAREVWDHIRRERPVAIHLFNGEGYPWSLLWARRAEQEGIPFLVTLHDPEPHPGNLWELANSYLRRDVVRRSTGVHVHAAVFTDVTLRMGARRVKVIPHGSLADRFLRHRRDGVSREPVALFFGRLEAYKGLDVLVEAGLMLRGRLRVIIAGPGRLPRALRLSTLAHPDVFELHDRYLEDHEVARLFQRASVCALPYRHVTQSSVPLIAAAFGVPVVASALGGFLEDVPRVGGVLVPSGDAKALAEAMLEAVHRKAILPAELEFSRLAPEFARWYEECTA